MSIPGSASPLFFQTAAAAAASDVGPIKSLRFNGNGNDDPYLERSVSSASNRRTFTFAAWVKNDFKPGNDDRIFSAGTSPSNIFDITLSSSNEGSHLRIYNKTTTVHTNWNTANKLRDASAWFHIVVGIDTTQATQADRVKVYINGVHITENGTTNTLPSQNAQMAVNDAVNHYIGRSGYYGGDRLAGYLGDIYFIDGSQLDPTSFGAFDESGVWRSAAYSGTYGTNGFHLLDFANESTIGHDSSGNSNDFTAYNFLTETGQYLDDFSGSQRSGFEWAFAFDGDFDLGSVPNPSSSWTFTPSTSIPFTTLAIYAYKDSSPGTLKINGTDISSQVPNHNGIGPNQRTVITGLTSPLTSIQNISNGSLANVVFAGLEIDGSVLLDRRAEVDIMLDVPTNDTSTTDTCAGGEIKANYATLNPLQSGLDLSNGNLGFSIGTRSDWKVATGTIHITSGKWFWEITNGKQYTAGGNIIYGLRASNASSPLVTTGGTTAELGYNDGNKGYMSSALKRDGGSGTTSYGVTFGTNDVIGVAFDADAGTLSFYKNGINQGVAFTGLTGSWAPAVALYTGGTQVSPWEFYINFGALPFRYPIVHSQLISGAIAGSPYEPTKAFDGSLSTYADHNSANSTLTYSNTLTGVTSLRVYIHQGNSTGTVTTVGANGTQTDTIAADFGPGYHTISLSTTGSTIHSIAFTRGGSGNFLSIYAIEVNGVVLTDSAATGFKTLNTANLPTPTIADGSDHFNTVLYTGNGSARSITTGHSSDFVWIKMRNSGNNHFLFDIVRGVGRRLMTSGTNDEDGDSSTDTLTSFNSDGFSLGADTATGGVNANNVNLVAWSWDAGSSTVSNTDGSVTSSVRANQTAGISIVTYTNPSSGSFTVGHGLNADIGMIITKHRNRSSDWYVWHSAYTSEDDYINLNSTAAKGTATDFWGASPPGSSTFGGKIGTSALAGDTDVAIVFSAVEGFSSFGSYTGNGSSDGPFAYTGHKIAWLMLKDSSSTGAWIIWDIARQAHNVQGPYLLANTTDTEQDSDLVDFLSNGFKIRTTAGSMNSSSQTYIWAAFAENPFSSNGGLAR